MKRTVLLVVLANLFLGCSNAISGGAILFDNSACAPGNGQNINGANPKGIHYTARTDLEADRVSIKARNNESNVTSVWRMKVWEVENFTDDLIDLRTVALEDIVVRNGGEGTEEWKEFLFDGFRLQATHRYVFSVEIVDGTYNPESAVIYQHTIGDAGLCAETGSAYYNADLTYAGPNNSHPFLIVRNGRQAPS